jgi:hypothetical protein
VDFDEGLVGARLGEGRGGVDEEGCGGAGAVLDVFGTGVSSLQEGLRGE